MVQNSTQVMKIRQYRLRNIPIDVWTLVKDVQRSTEQKTGSTVTFENALYELIRLMYKTSQQNNSQATK